MREGARRRRRCPVNAEVGMGVRRGRRVGGGAGRMAKGGHQAAVASSASRPRSAAWAARTKASWRGGAATRKRSWDKGTG